jgi:hypothetical protein
MINFKLNSRFSSKLALAFCLPLCLGLVGGCTTPLTPEYDAKFGVAVREARLKMTIDPDAGKNPDMALGVHGGAAKETLIRYQNSFKAPPPVTNVINIGGSLGSGGGGQN